MAGAHASTLSTNPAAVKAAHHDYLFPCAPPLYDDPLILTEGHGVWVTDASGREFLDFFAGILTTGIGHCHPEVVERVREQLGQDVSYRSVQIGAGSLLARWSVR